MPEAKFFEVTAAEGNVVEYVLAYNVEDVLVVMSFLKFTFSAEKITQIARFEIPYGAKIINAIS